MNLRYKKWHKKCYVCLLNILYLILDRSNDERLKHFCKTPVVFLIIQWFFVSKVKGIPYISITIIVGWEKPLNAIIKFFMQEQLYYIGVSLLHMKPERLMVSTNNNICVIGFDAYYTINSHLKTIIRRIQHKKKSVILDYLLTIMIFSKTLLLLLVLIIS